MSIADASRHAAWIEYGSVCGHASTGATQAFDRPQVAPHL
jgi:hypothetical protein